MRTQQELPPPLTHKLVDEGANHAQSGQYGARARMFETGAQSFAATKNVSKRPASPSAKADWPSNQQYTREPLLSKTSNSHSSMLTSLPVHCRFKVTKEPLASQGPFSSASNPPAKRVKPRPCQPHHSTFTMRPLLLRGSLAPTSEAKIRQAPSNQVALQDFHAVLVRKGVLHARIAPSGSSLKACLLKRLV